MSSNRADELLKVAQGVELFLARSSSPLTAAARGAEALLPLGCSVLAVDVARPEACGPISAREIERRIGDPNLFFFEQSHDGVDLEAFGLRALVWIPIFSSDEQQLLVAALIVQSSAALSRPDLDPLLRYCERIADNLLQHLIQYSTSGRLLRPAFSELLDRALASARRTARSIAVLAIRGPARIDSSELPIGEIDPATSCLLVADRSPEQLLSAAQVHASHPEVRVGIASTDALGAEVSAAQMLDAVAVAVGSAGAGSVVQWTPALGAWPSLESLSAWRVFEALGDPAEMDRLLAATVEALCPIISADYGAIWLPPRQGSHHEPWRPSLRSGDSGSIDAEAALIERAVEHAATAGDVSGTRAIAVPLRHDTETFAVLHLGRTSGTLSLSGADRERLEALGARIGSALKDVRIMSAARLREKQASRLLHHEAIELRRLLRARAGLVGNDVSMETVMRSIERCSGANLPVLIRGETGTGKEAVARLIHRLSGRSGPLVVVDCGAIPASLLESELFGYEKGAFTGAESRKTGRFQEADGGTIFLDEIGELPLPLQPKLLRVLQESTVRPVGGTAEIRLDFRLVAATNRDLSAMAAQRAFREDLLFRLRVMEIELPPLRERGEDVVLLALYYVRQYCMETEREFLSITPEAQAALLAHDWPGNVRELQNTIRRAVVMAPGPELHPRDLQLEPASARPQSPAPAPVESDPEETNDGALEEVVADWFWESWVPAPEGSPKETIESHLLRAALLISGGSVGRAAELVAMHPDTFGSRIAKLGQAATSRSVRNHRLATALEDELSATLHGRSPAQATLPDRISAALLRELLVHCKGRKSEMARVMGWGRQTLLRHLRRLEILTPDGA